MPVEPVLPELLQNWHTRYGETLRRAASLKVAIQAEDWGTIDSVCLWLRREFFFQVSSEERGLVHLLEEIGAGTLRERLVEDDRQLHVLNQYLLRRPGPGGSVEDLEMARRMLVLFQRLVEVKECLLLPLLAAAPGVCPGPPASEGYLILEKRLLTPGTWSFHLLAPLVARGRKPGQFLMVAPFPDSERIPLTQAGGDARRGWISFVMVEAGATTRALAKLEPGDRLHAVVGPLGTPTELAAEGTVVLVAGGYGAGAVLAAAEVLHARGQRTVTTLGGRSRERVLLAEELAAVSSELLVTTNDGSWGRQGWVTEALLEVLDREAMARVIAMGQGRRAAEAIHAHLAQGSEGTETWPSPDLGRPPCA